MTLRVAVDSRTLQARPLGGVARSTLGHLRHLSDSVDLTLLTDARLPPIDPDLVWGLPQVPLHGPSRRGVTWLQVAVPRHLRAFNGIFHCPFYGLPFLQPVPMVATIHDITFEQHPEWFTREQRLVFRMQARHAARTARHLLTPSAFTRDEVCARYDVAEDRVSVAPNLLDPVYAQPAPRRPQWLDRRGVGSRYVLAIGGARRRGVDLLSRAWPLVRSKAEVSLVIVGDPGVEPPTEAVVVRGISDDDWRGALAAAELFCYPTRHEGFGYPALEACAMGTPVVCAPVGALPEVLGDAAAWVEPLAAEPLAAMIVSLLDDGARRASLIARGRARAADVDELEVGATVLRAFELAAG